MPDIFHMPRQWTAQASGAPYAGAKLYFYRAGTLVQQSVYQDIGLATAHEQPVEADDSGKFPVIYLNNNADFNYRVIVRSQYDTLIDDIDDYPRSPIGDLANTSDTTEGDALVGVKYNHINAVALNLHDYIEDDGSYNVMGFIPQNLKSAIRDNTSTTDHSAYFNNAIQASFAVQIPNGTYNWEANVAARRGTTLRGGSQLWCKINVVGAITGLALTEDLSEPLRGSLTIENFTLEGDSNTVALLALTRAGNSTIRRIRFRNGIKQVTLAQESHAVTLADCYFSGWKDYAIDNTGLSSLMRVLRNRFNIVTSVDGSTCTAATSACIQIADSTNLRVIGCEVNGDDELASFIKFVGSVGTASVKGCYVEGITNPAILTSGASSLVNGLEVSECNLSTDDSTSIDLTSNSLQHVGVIINHVRRPEVGSGFNVLNPGSAIDYTYRGVTLESGTLHVAGFDASIKNVVRRGSRFIVNDATGESVGPFTQDNVAASQNSVALGGDRWIAPRSGWVTGVVVRTTESRTAGTLTIEVRKNTGLSGALGSALGLSAVINGTDTNRATSFATPGVSSSTNAFDTGDEIYCTITTDGSWTPTTSDVRVYLEVMY